MTPTQAAILYAVAKAAIGNADEALGSLIEDGLLDPDQHIESDDWLQALSDAEED
jgi:hypothetical protein